MRIEVEIDELILDDASPAERLRVAQALETELERLLVADGGLSNAGQWQSEIDLKFLDGGRVETGSRLSRQAPQRLGGAVAQAIHGGLRSTLVRTGSDP